MLLTRIRNSVQNAYIVTHGSCHIFIYHYLIFIWEVYIFICTHFMHCINRQYIELTVLYDSVSHDDSNA